MIKPLHKNILVEIEEEIITRKGLIISNEESTTKKGLILAVGKNVEQLIEKQRIIFNLEDSLEINHDNKKYFILNEEKVLALIEED